MAFVLRLKAGREVVSVHMIPATSNRSGHRQKRVSIPAKTAAAAARQLNPCRCRRPCRLLLPPLPPPSRPAAIALLPAAVALLPLPSRALDALV